ncbi:hypothetical protein V5799_024391 [Amblyomma americanum]|uniref:Uncharacterized protein n=1 Tax=Amblyomma americanum TaxID=6943 RepID=A0AAQ4EC75_AMBAM
MDWLRDLKSRASRWYIFMDMSVSLFGAILQLVLSLLSAIDIINEISSVLNFGLKGIMVVLAGLIFVRDMYLMVRRYHRAFIKWRRSNFSVVLVLPKDGASANGSSPSPGPQPPSSKPPNPLPSALNCTTAANNNATAVTTGTHQDSQTTENGFA